MPEGSFEDRVKSLSENVTEVRSMTDGEITTIAHVQQTAGGGEYLVSSFFDDARVILSRLVDANHGKPLKTVHFFVKYPAADRLGNSFDALGMEITYDMAAFQGAQWGNMTFFDLAELPSEVSFRRIGAQAAIEYCNEGDNVKYTPTFCSKVLAFAMR